jgi:hypothetical protein
VSSGGSVAAVSGSSAGSTVTVNGTEGGLDVFEVNPDFSSYLGPVFLSGQPSDYAYYDDYFNANPQTYTVSTDPALPQSLVLESTDAAPIRFDDLSEVVFYLPLVGGSTINIKGVPAQTFLNMAVSSDTVTLGSIAPNLGGTLANIMGPVAVASYSPDDMVSLVLDDSGNADVTPKNVLFTPRNGPYDYGDHIEGFAPNAVYWNLGANASIALRGGAADESFALVSTTSAAAISIDGGGGINTLDYSGYAGPTSGGVDSGVVVNLPLGTATGLKGGIANIQNVIGSPGNDTLIAGAARSILIGSGGNDQLVAGLGQDLLIASTTAYTQPVYNAAAFDAILQEWNRIDLGFDDRLSDLLTGSNSQGVAAKNVIGGTAILFDAATVRASAGNTNQVYVNSLWLKLLGRNATAAELNNTTNLDLANASVRTNLINAITSSAEYRQDTVDQIYQHYLHHTALNDPAGLSGFTSLLASGGTQEEVAALVLGSPEYFSDSGGTNAAFISSLYQDTLGRGASAAELDGFMKQLGNGASRTTVARALLTSQEYFNNLVNFPAASGQITTTNPFLPYGYFQLFLGRNANGFEATGFINELRSGIPNETVIAQILSSSEYFNKSPQTAVLV